MNKLISLALAALCAASAYAVPAKPTPMVFAQPDGTELSVMLRGDERYHWYESEDGYILINQNNTLYYGNVDANGALKASAIMAKAAANRGTADREFLQSVDKALVGKAIDKAILASPRRLAEAAAREANAAAGPAKAPMQAPEDSYGIGLFSGTQYPSMGEQKGLVILVQYTDVSFNLTNPYDYFNRMLNEPNFSDYGGTGSARDFFMQNSNNQFLPQFDVFGPITLPQNQAYYGGNDWSGNDKNPHMMAIHACQLLDGEIDFTQYDRDNDGKIDNVFIFYAGRGEASGGSSNTVWPHSWDVSSATSTIYRFDGKRLDRYACSNEWESGRPDGVGTFVHEFSHVMGLPDLYATSYTSSFTPGAWSALDYGPYNNNGCTPPNFGAFERNALGWMRPTILTDLTGKCDLNPITSNEGYLIPTSKSTEFFLLENRQKTGWDSYIPGHGMLIWHVDYNSSVWSQNTVNNTPAHQYVDIEEADGTQSESDRAGDSWPGTKNKTDFNQNTNPALKTWSGTGIDIPIANIRENGGVISFFAGYAHIDPPGNVTMNEVDPSTITTTSFAVSWTKDAMATNYRLNVKIGDTFVNNWNLRDMGDTSSATITGLQPGTTYSVSVVPYNEREPGNESNIVRVTTLPPTLDYFTTVALPASEVNGTYFTANWIELDDATDYVLNLWKLETSGISSDTVNFDNGIKNLPKGWSTDALFSYTTEGNFGEAAPSLRFTQAGYIQSPTYNDDVIYLSFWYKAINTDPASTLHVQYRSGSAWQVLESLPLNTSEAQTFVCEEIPANATGIRLDYAEATHRGSLAIDDIVVVYGGHRTITSPVAKWSGFHAGDTNSAVIFGLEPESTYAYNVQGINENYKAKTSQTINVTTTDDPTEYDPDTETDPDDPDVGGIGAINAESAPAEYFNLQGIRVHNPKAGLYIEKRGNTVRKVQL